MDDPVRAQLEAYNAHDVDAFVACYAPDAVVADAHGTVLLQGAEALRSSYGALFTAHPDVRASVLERLHPGSWTVEHERASRSGDTLDVLVAYEVADGLIRHVVMFR